MKSRRPILVVLLVISLHFVQAVAQKRTQPQDMTLAQARHTLVGAKVVIIGKTSRGSSLKGYLYDWYIAVESDGEYRQSRDLMNYISDSYQGKEAAVIAVQLNRLEKERSEVGGTNALGEKITDDALVNPYVDVVVRFTDGTIAMTTSYLSLIFSDSDLTRPFKLLSEKNARATVINAQLSSIVGKTVYAVAYSRLFLPTASLESLMEISRYSAQQMLEFPRLQPLIISKAAYNEEKDVIIIKLRDESSKEYLCLSNFDSHDDKISFFERVAQSYPASLRTLIPTDLTPREIEAIRKGSIFNGMSKRAVYYTIGFPEKENDWGRGGKQFVYFNGKIFVYIDGTDHVRDWQSVER